MPAAQQESELHKKHLPIIWLISWCLLHLCPCKNVSYGQWRREGERCRIIKSDAKRLPFYCVFEVPLPFVNLLSTPSSVAVSQLIKKLRTTLKNTRSPVFSNYAVAAKRCDVGAFHDWPPRVMNVWFNAENFISTRTYIVYIRIATGGFLSLESCGLLQAPFKAERCAAAKAKPRHIACVPLVKTLSRGGNAAFSKCLLQNKWKVKSANNGCWFQLCVKHWTRRANDGVVGRKKVFTRDSPKAGRTVY